MMLGGTLIVRNGIELDYCFEAALQSLLEVCDQVAVVDGTSTDGTWEWLVEKRKQSSKLLLKQSAWKPSAMGLWLSELTNEARVMLQTASQICLQSDEVLHEDDYPAIRRYARRGGTCALERLNFWMDAQHLLPPEEKVGTRIVRLAPASLPSVGDAQSLDPARGFEAVPIRLWHYGFLRRPAALAVKGRAMQEAIFNSVDPIWADVEARGGAALIDPKNATAVAPERLRLFTGTHPKAAQAWLKEHGYGV